jgi:preprotein translocase subunit SecB
MSEDVRDQHLVIRAQYIKDQSFENPNAPEIFMMMKEETPKIDINVDVSPQMLSDRTYEVTLSLRADAKVGENQAFLVELEFAALVSLGEGLTEEQGQAALFIETPRQIFPFARAIVANITRDGGFPPLVINPIDFRQMFEQQSAAKSDETAEHSPPAAAEA